MTRTRYLRRFVALAGFLAAVAIPLAAHAGAGSQAAPMPAATAPIVATPTPATPIVVPTPPATPATLPPALYDGKPATQSNYDAERATTAAKPVYDTSQQPAGNGTINGLPESQANYDATSPALAPGAPGSCQDAQNLKPWLDYGCGS